MENINTKVKQFLSTCSGKIMNVYYELYEIIDSINEEDQYKVVMYFCENFDSIESDSSLQITKNYYNDEQLRRISQKFHEKRLHEKISSLADDSSRKGVSPETFYNLLWASLTKTYRTKRERALVLYELSKDDFIPYRSIGTGLSMSNKEYKEVLNRIDLEMLYNTEYILKLDYEQKTQFSSLIVDNLLKLNDRTEQSVYMSVVFRIIEQNIKDHLKDIID